MNYKAGFVGLIGLPNAGKSTLLNVLVQQKLSIVTSKPQTTRRRVLGVETFTSSQVIIVDAPGVVEASRGLNAFLQKEAQNVIGESDVLVAVLSIDEERKENLERIIQLVSTANKPWFYVITKVDLAHYFHRKEQIKSDLKEKYPEVKGIEFSNQWGKDLESFRADFFALALASLPTMPCPLYDPEIYTPHSTRELVAEIVREKCFELLSHELPYQIAVRIRSFDEQEKLVRIEADILVGKENHKAMVIGSGGAKIKQIGQAARADIEAMLDHPCFLNLTVVVRENWMENRLIMKELGYVSIDKK
jgi:GTP-binding protein Era